MYIVLRLRKRTMYSSINLSSKETSLFICIKIIENKKEVICIKLETISTTEDHII